MAVLQLSALLLKLFCNGLYNFNGNMLGWCFKKTYLKFHKEFFLLWILIRNTLSEALRVPGNSKIELSATYLKVVARLDGTLLSLAALSSMKRYYWVKVSASHLKPSFSISFIPSIFYISYYQLQMSINIIYFLIILFQKSNTPSKAFKYLFLIFT